jgi:hypothetical protein
MIHTAPETKLKKGEGSTIISTDVPAHGWLPRALPIFSGGWALDTGVCEKR